MIMGWFGRPKRLAIAGRVEPGDAAFMNSVHAAQVIEPTPYASWSIYLLLVAILCAVSWASIAKVEVITKAEARVIPEAREQVVASLEGGIIRELLVHEGQPVEAGQALARLDPTRFEAQEQEGRAKRVALRAAIARLEAEVAGRPLVFPDDVQSRPQIVQAESEAYEARRNALLESVASGERSVQLVQRELSMSEAMSAKGLLSDVEVMRLRREVNDLKLQNQDRLNRFRQDAAAELARARAELAQLDEELVARQDQVKRTLLTSPVKGFVKNIRMNTVGGVVPGGAPVMEIVPLGPRVLIEAKVKPADVGFLRVGQRSEVKLSAYEYNIYGSLKGTVEYISPDALGESERGADTSYYRVWIRAESSTLKAHGEPLAVLPGMTGIAEINTHQRTVMSFLMQPLLKSREALRER
jgi:adhesin transport system membrane fusion protein